MERSEILSRLRELRKLSMRYQARRVGHAPGQLRDALHKFVNHYWLSTNPLPDVIFVCGERQSLTWLLGQLWNCTDILPDRYAHALHLERGTTYARAVRKIAEEE